MRGRPFYGLSRTQIHNAPGAGFNAALVILFFGGVGFFVIVGLHTPVDQAIVPIIGLGSVIVLLTSFLLIGAGLRSRHEQQGIGRVKRSEVWIHWQYSPEEWRKYVDNLSELPLKLYPRATIAIGIGFGLLVGFIGSVGNPRLMFPVMAPIGAYLALLILASGPAYSIRWRHTQAAQIRRRLAVESPQLWIGPSGLVHETEGYLAFDKLIKVNYIGSSPARLIFTVLIHAGRGVNIEMPVLIPVPSGLEAEAGQLVARFEQRSK